MCDITTRRRNKQGIITLVQQQVRLTFGGSTLVEFAARSRASRALGLVEREGMGRAVDASLELTEVESSRLPGLALHTGRPRLTAGVGIGVFALDQLAVRSLVTTTTPAAHLCDRWLLLGLLTSVARIGILAIATLVLLHRLECIPHDARCE